MSSKTPEVGDTVVIRGVVVENHREGYILVKSPGGIANYLVSRARITEVIPKPWEPKIGEEVDICGKLSSPFHGFTLLNVHGDGGPFHDGSIRKWATVAYLADKPEVVLYSHLLKRKDLTSCAD